MWKRVLKYLIGAVTIVSLVIGTQIVAAETGMVIRFDKTPGHQISIGHAIESFSLGMAGVAYATTPDYICDGVADDVEIQAAMNALPATGGELFFFGGNYVLTATVTRAINNISIVGSGYSTYFANDGGTALFSNGAQTGWHFENFRTDAGYLTLATACTMQNVWDNTYYVDTTVGTGATLPTHPRTGQQFLHTPAGRIFLMEYDGTNWNPIHAYGSTTLYVDAAGTDDFNHGYGAGANAFLTVQYAVNAIPENNPVQTRPNIYVGAGDFAEAVSFPWYVSCNIYGTMVQVDALVATGGNQGAGATVPSVTGAFVAGVYDNMICHFTSGANNGEYRVVSYNTNARIYLVGNALDAAPAAPDTYEILDWDTTLDSVYMREGAQFLYDMELDGDTVVANNAVGFCYTSYTGIPIY